jgi:hypothetical protein
MLSKVQVVGIVVQATIMMSSFSTVLDVNGMGKRLIHHSPNVDFLQLWPFKFDQRFLVYHYYLIFGLFNTF